MEKSLQEETERLKESWAQHDENMLRDYLVSSVEDPRLNLQSILTRHFLIRACFGSRFDGLKAAEILFAAGMNWLFHFFQEYPSPEDAQAVLHALQQGSDNADGIEVPPYLAKLFHSFPKPVDGVLVPNFLQQALQTATGTAGKSTLTDDAKNTFQNLWAKRLARCKPKNVSVLEPACGSANDYRFLETFGLARLLDYTGFDLCEKNVANARQLFPTTRFETGNALQIQAQDKSFDFSFVHDLFEHLSLQAVHAAVGEICRVTRRGLCIHFFSMGEQTNHLINPVEKYHWNRLSMGEMRNLFIQHGCTHVQVIHIGAFLEAFVPGAQTHNEHAYTFWVTK